jgi:apolipoprotein N-acyltransferase
LLLVATALGVGSWIVGLSKLDRPVAEATRTALLVQGNGDPFGRAVSAVAELDVYTQLTREGTGHLSPPPSYVIWPEGAVLGNTLDGRAGEATRQIVQKSAAGLTLIVGSRAFEAGKSFNSAYSLSGGQVFDRYDKRFLVPFGERWPLIETAAPLYRAVFGLLGLPLLISTSPGKALEPLLTPEGPVAAYICYESVFPQVQRLMVRRGSELLINITNDAWFARGNGARQHFDMGRMRAIETRRYLLRAGNDGITAVVDPRGESRLELERRVQGSLLVSYGLDAELTPYVRYGHLLVYVLITYLVLAGAAMRVMGNE